MKTQIVLCQMLVTVLSALMILIGTRMGIPLHRVANVLMWTCAVTIILSMMFIRFSASKERIVRLSVITVAIGVIMFIVAAAAYIAPRGSHRLFIWALVSMSVTAVGSHVIVSSSKTGLLWVFFSFCAQAVVTAYLITPFFIFR